jgi:hypothetical protein
MHMSTRISIGALLAHLCVCLLLVLWPYDSTGLAGDDLLVLLFCLAALPLSYLLGLAFAVYSFAQRHSGPYLLCIYAACLIGLPIFIFASNGM